MIADIVQTGLTSWWAPALAFVAGAVSFASPCVLPLVPGYVSFVTGERAAGDAQRRPLMPILLFIAGFTIVFTLLGAFASTFVPMLRDPIGQRVAGLVVIAIGLAMIGYGFGWGSPRMYAERRPFLARVRPGAIGALPLGMAFAAGWTPCIGPVLAGILGIAASETTAKATLLLASYSLGLGLPFLLVGLGVQRLMGAFGWVKRHYTWIAACSGALLIVVGALLASGLFTRLFAPLARFAPGL